MHIYNNNLIGGTVESLYQVSDFKIGNFTVAQALDYLPGFGQDQNWNIVKLILIIASIILGALIAIVIVGFFTFTMNSIYTFKILDIQTFKELFFRK